jgi:hypothetical protein
MTRATARGALKTTISLPEQTAGVLRSLAAARNVSYAEVIRRAITVEKYLSDVRDEGGRVLIEDADKLIKEIVVF